MNEGTLCRHKWIETKHFWISDVSCLTDYTCEKCGVKGFKTSLDRKMRRFDVRLFQKKENV